MTYTRSPASTGGDTTGENPSTWALAQPSDGAFDVAGMAGWMARRAMQVNPEIEPNLRATVRGIVGSDFTAKELQVLQDRALNAAEMEDLRTLQGIRAGTPVGLTPAQKATIDRLIQGMGTDPLGRRAGEAYGKALKDGQIRVR